MSGRITTTNLPAFAGHLHGRTVRDAAQRTNRITLHKRRHVLAGGTGFFVASRGSHHRMIPPPLPGRFQYVRSGYGLRLALLWRVALHSWLHSIAPAGADSNSSNEKTPTHVKNPCLTRVPFVANFDETTNVDILEIWLPCRTCV